jgi:hypothetical protein
MALFKLFGGDSQSQTTTNVTTNTDSFNTTYSASNVVSNAGNVNLDLSKDSAAEKAFPLLVLVAAVLLYFWGNKR